jgi:hypothetical protein
MHFWECMEDVSTGNDVALPSLYKRSVTYVLYKLPGIWTGAGRAWDRHGSFGARDVVKEPRVGTNVDNCCCVAYLK